MRVHDAWGEVHESSLMGEAVPSQACPPPPPPPSISANTSGPALAAPAPSPSVAATGCPPVAPPRASRSVGRFPAAAAVVVAVRLPRHGNVSRAPILLLTIVAPQRPPSVAYSLGVSAQPRPGFRAQGLEVRVQGLGFRRQGLELRVQNLGLRI